MVGAQLGARGGGFGGVSFGALPLAAFDGNEVSDYRRWVAAQFPSPEPAGQAPPPAAHRAAAREVRRGVRGYTGRWGVTHGVWGEVYLMCEDF